MEKGELSYHSAKDRLDIILKDLKQTKNIDELEKLTIEAMNIIEWYNKKLLNIEKLIDRNLTDDGYEE